MSARLAPLAKDDWGDDVRDALRRGLGDAAAGAFGEEGPDAPPMPSVLSTLLRHPKLAGPFLAYNFVLLQQPSIDPRLRELMVLRVAWRTRAPYEWLQHVRLAMTVGVTSEEIGAIAGTSDVRWSPLERDLLAATDQLIDGYRIADDTWQRLAERLDERQLIEMLFVVGTYTALAMVFNSLELELDADLHPFAVAVPMPERGR